MHVLIVRQNSVSSSLLLRGSQLLHLLLFPTFLATKSNERNRTSREVYEMVSCRELACVVWGLGKCKVKGQAGPLIQLGDPVHRGMPHHGKPGRSSEGLQLIKLGPPSHPAPLLLKIA